MKSINPVKVLVLILFILGNYCTNAKRKHDKPKCPKESNSKECKMPLIETISNDRTMLGEEPHWDIETQSLFFVDVLGSAIFRYDYREDKTYKSNIANESNVDFIIPIKFLPYHFAVGLTRRVVILQWDGRSSYNNILFTLFQIDNEPNINRFNEAKADPRGRFFGGTIITNLPEDLLDVFKMNRTTNLYRWQKGGTPIAILQNLGISNGITWNTVTKKFYFIDSLDSDIKEFDYNQKTGEISNPRVVINLLINETYPGYIVDGMTIDENGYLFAAGFNASKVLKINPADGEIVQEIHMPAKIITSVAFGGPNLDILYVTSGNLYNEAAPAGQIFKITGLGTRGVKMFKLKI